MGGAVLFSSVRAAGDERHRQLTHVPIHFATLQ